MRLVLLHGHRFMSSPRTFYMYKYTPSVPNYRSFDFFNPKFDNSSYSKIYAKYHFFCCELLYQYKFFKSDLNLTMFAQIFWIRRMIKLDAKKVKWPIIWNGGSKSFQKSWRVKSSQNLTKIIERNTKIYNIK